MTYTTEVIVDVPLTEFMGKFDHVENMKHWQKGLVSIEHVSGNPGMVGAKMKLHYYFGKRTMEIMETITHSDLPHEFHATYSTNSMLNMQKNYFEALAQEKTKWTSVSDFMPLTFTMRAMLWIMPKAFKKQSRNYMMDFKNFAEKGISVADEKA